MQELGRAGPKGISHLPVLDEKIHGNGPTLRVVLMMPNISNVFKWEGGGWVGGGEGYREALLMVRLGLNT